MAEGKEGWQKTGVENGGGREKQIGEPGEEWKGWRKREREREFERGFGDWVRKRYRDGRIEFEGTRKKKGCRDRERDGGIAGVGGHWEERIDDGGRDGGRGREGEWEMKRERDADRYGRRERWREGGVG